MKRSAVPTQYVLVKATSSFDGDDCHFALFNFSKDDLEDMRAYLVTAKLAQASATNNFCSIIYYSSTVGYFKFSERLPSATVAEILGDNHFAFVETDEDEICDLESPEVAIDEERLEVYPDGNFFYQAVCEGTDTVFRTSEIKLNVLEKYFE